MSISSTVWRCLAAFKLTDCVSDETIKAEIQDEEGRFRVWVGNISAHRNVHSRRSLEYRLRDSSDLQTMAQSLLEDMLQALEDVQSALAKGVDLRLEGSPSVEKVDDSDDVQSLFEVDEEELNRSTPLQAVVEELHEVNSCLLRFSMALRNPARQDQMRKHAAIDVQHFQPHDLKHVQEKHPAAPIYLLRRLARAISGHRQYFKYREAHHNKLAEGLDNDEEEDEQRPSTIATSLHSADRSGPVITDLDSDAASVYTATSYAPSMSGQTVLRPPTWPDEAVNGEPFECSICFGIIIADSDRSWRQHVYEDLPPYICTHEDCSNANTPFSRRRDWLRHETKVHNRKWTCPFGCVEDLTTFDSFKRHMQDAHEQHLDPNSLQSMSDSCSQPREMDGPLSCVLCGEAKPTTKLLFKHVGHHLEQLALFALPRHLLGTGSDSDADAEGNSALGDVADDEERADAAASPSRSLSHNQDLDSAFGEDSGDGGGNVFGSEDDELAGSEPTDHLKSLSRTRSDNPPYGSQPDFDSHLYSKEGEVRVKQLLEEEAEVRMKVAPSENVDALRSVDERLTEYWNQQGKVAEEATAEEMRMRAKIEKAKSEAKDREAKEWEEFLRKQEVSKQREEMERKSEEERLSEEMRKRLSGFGYTQAQIDSMVNQAKAKKEKPRDLGSMPEGIVGKRPTYAKVHREYLDLATLEYYNLPYEFDRSDPDYIIILRELDEYETDVLFEHTRRLRSGQIAQGEHTKQAVNGGAVLKKMFGRKKEKPTRQPMDVSANATVPPSEELKHP